MTGSRMFLFSIVLMTAIFAQQVSVTQSGISSFELTEGDEYQVFLTIESDSTYYLPRGELKFMLISSSNGNIVDEFSAQVKELYPLEATTIEAYSTVPAAASGDYTIEAYYLPAGNLFESSPYLQFGAINSIPISIASNSPPSAYFDKGSLSIDITTEDASTYNAKISISIMDPLNAPYSLSREIYAYNEYRTESFNELLRAGGIPGGSPIAGMASSAVSLSKDFPKKAVISDSLTLPKGYYIAKYSVVSQNSESTIYVPLGAGESTTPIQIAVFKYYNGNPSLIVAYSRPDISISAEQDGESIPLASDENTTSIYSARLAKTTEFTIRAYDDGSLVDYVLVPYSFQEPTRKISEIEVSIFQEQNELIVNSRLFDENGNEVSGEIQYLILLNGNTTIYASETFESSGSLTASVPIEESGNYTVIVTDSSGIASGSNSAYLTAKIEEEDEEKLSPIFTDSLPMLVLALIIVVLIAAAYYIWTKKRRRVGGG